MIPLRVEHALIENIASLANAHETRTSIIKLMYLALIEHAMPFVLPINSFW